MEIVGVRLWLFVFIPWYFSIGQSEVGVFTAEGIKSLIISAQEHARSLRWSIASRASPLQLKDDLDGRGELTSRLGPSLIVQSLISPPREGISSLKGSFQILQPEMSSSKGHFI